MEPTASIIDTINISICRSDCMEINDDLLEMHISDALMRIRRDYERTDGQIYLSFSGGKDSTVLAELIKMADLPTNIAFVYSDTGIEFDAIKNFVKEYDYPNVVFAKPRKPYAEIAKLHGRPALSKMKSHALRVYQSYIDEPLNYAIPRQLITGEREKGGVKLGMRTNLALSVKHFHLLHPDLEYKISEHCCTYLKKYPFEDYSLANNMNGYYSGIRMAEGGIRSMRYKSCVEVKKLKGKEIINSMPIIDWTDDIMEMFIQKYNVKLSDAYTVYGLKRTGCVGCPYSQNLKDELAVCQQYEPNRYKASLYWFKDIYVDMGVELPFDEDYMKYFHERSKLNEQRRIEMLEHFKPHMNKEIRKNLFKGDKNE